MSVRGTSQAPRGGTAPRCTPACRRRPSACSSAPGELTEEPAERGIAVGVLVGPVVGDQEVLLLAAPKRPALRPGLGFVRDAVAADDANGPTSVDELAGHSSLAGLEPQRTELVLL